ncbi:hypothetical protein, partial [Streptomyces sp. NPDC058664]|uniref:hypothetical protein n=1 Tax=unclassified Streptomyces TaxID=2593676 RepID=UPI003649B1C3
VRKGFRSVGSAQRFLSAFTGISPHFRPGQHLKERFVPEEVFGKSHGVSGLGPHMEACEDAPVECDVCDGRCGDGQRCSAVTHSEIWSCSWCHATTYMGGEWFEVVRPPYLPVEIRWNLAIADGLPADLSHASGNSGRTLRGIQEAGMSPSGLAP